MSPLEPSLRRPTKSDSPSANELAVVRAELRERSQAVTPARLWQTDVAVSYGTAMQLQLRADHAAARDAVAAELSLSALNTALPAEYQLIEVSTQARSKAEYLAQPVRGRRLSASALTVLRERCPVPTDVQIVVGDGLSATAVHRQVPELLPALMTAVHARGWTAGPPFAVRYCRVGVLNDIGEGLPTQVVVLLIGERPGLATAESLSAYLAYAPRSADTDAHRNLISNIHAQGVSHPAAVVRIVDLIEQMRSQRCSGVMIKERLPDRLPAPPQSQAAWALPQNHGACQRTNSQVINGQIVEGQIVEVQHGIETEPVTHDLPEWTSEGHGC
jgi:ethanolamine ammonia-lyase small subunit